MSSSSSSSLKRSFEVGQQQQSSTDRFQNECGNTNTNQFISNKKIMTTSSSTSSFSDFESNSNVAGVVKRESSSSNSSSSSSTDEDNNNSNSNNNNNMLMGDEFQDFQDAMCSCSSTHTCGLCASLNEAAALVSVEIKSELSGPRPEELADERGPYQVQSRVFSVVSRWVDAVPPSPEVFLKRLLTARGYDTSYIRSIDYRNKNPSIKQIANYDTSMVTAVRSSDLPTLKTFYAEGRSMSACNKFSESIVHMACRRSQFDMVDFIVRHGGDICIVDDYGRTPLHDACWRLTPQFDIVTLLLDRNVDLIRMIDVRGASPLKYVPEDMWLQWCAYFHHQKDKYWPDLKTSKKSSTSATKSKMSTFASDMDHMNLDKMNATGQAVSH